MSSNIYLLQHFKNTSFGHEFKYIRLNRQVMRNNTCRVSCRKVFLGKRVTVDTCGIYLKRSEEASTQITRRTGTEHDVRIIIEKRKAWAERPEIPGVREITERDSRLNDSREKALVSLRTSKRMREEKGSDLTKVLEEEIQKVVMGR